MSNPNSAATFKPQERLATDFPLRVGANGRYLVDQSGQPFLYHAETGWRMAQRLTLAEVETYLDDRVARGFNTIHLHAINKEKQGPLNQAGQYPFESPTDITRPNEPYWRHLDYILSAMAARGLLAVMSAAWFGYNGMGWRAQLNVEAAWAYGRFLGERYRRFDNILWVQGGDNDPGDRAEAAHALAAAIRVAAPHHLHTFHTGPENPSAAFFHADAWLDINLAYTYQEAYKQVLAEYRRPRPIRPIILGETGYEGEANTGFPWTASLVRRQPYWALLSGAAGHAYGSATIWHFGEGWRDALDKPALRHMSHVKALFAPRAWHRLVPDDSHALVTAGYESGATYAAAARADDGGFALVYVPTPRAFEVDMSALGGPVAASWFDPTSGEYVAIPGSPLANTGKHLFRSPATNSMGEQDALLVLEAQ